jgi:hypothetical protein
MIATHLSFAPTHNATLCHSEVPRRISASNEWIRLVEPHTAHHTEILHGASE